MNAKTRILGVLVGLAAFVVLGALVSLAVGVVGDFARENDNAILVSGGGGLYERYDPYATDEDVERFMGCTFVALAFLAIPNRHWMPGWRIRGALQAVGAAGTLIMLFLLFVDRAEYSPSNRPYTLAWQVPVLVVVAAGVLAHAWLTRVDAAPNHP
ncbi:MAG: hypothetical protein AABY18_08010 [Candidatus Thermoplasmatota archaeon]